MKIKNRGAISNPDGRFEKEQYEAYDDGWDLEEAEESLPTLETILFPEKGKTIITRNNSPDIGFDQSINPYRGCEHGCIYCYARPSHSYVNLSPGLDFETKIFYKVDAAQLLENELHKRNYQCRPIVLGANTDPYQPIESKLKVTRSLLEVMNRFNHPVVIITKSSMVERDLDILAAMAQRNLAKVAVSVTTLSNSLKLILEPRTSGPKGRLRAIKKLTAAGVPVRVMAAPMIPMINDMELEKILELCKKAGNVVSTPRLIQLINAPYPKDKGSTRLDIFKTQLARVIFQISFYKEKQFLTEVILLNIQYNPHYKKDFTEALLEIGDHPITAENLTALLKAGADFNAVSRKENKPAYIWMISLKGETCLSILARCGSSQSIHVLLDFGADPDTVNAHGISLLQTVLESPRFPIDTKTLLVKKILEKKADPNKSMEGESPPLIIAVQNHFTDIVRLLIKHGADPLLKDRHKKDAFYYASTEIANILRERQPSRSFFSSIMKCFQ